MTVPKIDYRWTPTSDCDTANCSVCNSIAPVREIPNNDNRYVCQICDCRVIRQMQDSVDLDKTSRLILVGVAQMLNNQLDRLLSRWDARQRAILMWRCNQVLESYPLVKRIYELEPGELVTVPIDDLQAVANKTSAIKNEVPQHMDTIVESIAARLNLKVKWNTDDFGVSVTFTDPREPEEAH